MHTISLLKKLLLGIGLYSFLIGSLYSQSITASYKSGDLTNPHSEKEFWDGVAPVKVNLTAQPMITPKPKDTNTPEIEVQAIHNGDWIQFRLKWKDADASFAGPVGKFSDGVAIQFPEKVNPSAVAFMGSKGNPVHIFHWKAQYQIDKEKGGQPISDIYPNMNMDMYPMEYKDNGSVEGLTESQRTLYSTGKEAGNPHSFPKTSALDELAAEGYGTLTPREKILGKADGQWANGEWTVVIARPIKYSNGSSITAGEKNMVAFAVWQGGKDEVGSRKCVTMSWINLELKK